MYRFAELIVNASRSISANANGIGCRRRAAVSIENDEKVRHNKTIFLQGVAVGCERRCVSFSQRVQIVGREIFISLSDGLNFQITFQ